MLTRKENVKDEVKTSKTSKSAASSSSNTSATCCQPPEKPANLPPVKVPPTPLVKQDGAADKKCCSKTRVTIKYDAGFPNQLHIRGKGANLSWEKGQPLKNIKTDEWVWETDAPFSNCEFKILINDQVYENGENHQITGGTVLLYTPHFY